MSEPIPNKDFTDGRLIRRHPVTNEPTDMAQTRERIIRTPANLIPLIDSVNILGWHDCSRNYYIDHGERNATNLIFITLAGGGTLELDGVIYQIVPGTMTIIPNNVRTVYYTNPGEEHWEFYWMHVRGVNVSNIFRRLYQSHNYMIRLKDPAIYTRIFEDILYSPLEGNAQALYNSRRISELLHLFVEEIISGRILISDNNNFVKTILQFMEANYMTNITNEDLSALVFMTPETIIRTFKKNTGYTPHAYLKMYRIMISCILLSNTDLPVKEIAQRVGYKSASNYSSEFRNLKGMSPVQFRNQYKHEKVNSQEESI